MPRDSDVAAVTCLDRALVMGLLCVLVTLTAPGPLGFGGQSPTAERAASSAHRDFISGAAGAGGAHSVAGTDPLPGSPPACLGMAG